MIKYKVPKLTSKTPAPDQKKLLNALKSVPGVASAQLLLETSEFSVQKGDREPKREDIVSAASKAGFAPAS